MRCTTCRPGPQRFSTTSSHRMVIGKNELMVFTDADSILRFALNLFPVSGVQESIFLSSADLAYQVITYVGLSAYGGMKMSREQELRRGTVNSLLLPTGSGKWGRST